MSTESATVAPARNRTSKQDFIKAFQAGASNAAVGEVLGITEQSVVQRAAALRKLGVKLKRMERKQSESTLDLDALNKLAAESAPAPAAPADAS